MSELRRNGSVLLGVTAAVCVGASGWFPPSAGIIANALHQAFGWSIGRLSLTQSLLAVGGGVGAPLCGLAINRFGSRPVAIVGFTVFVLVLLALAFAPAGFLLFAVMYALVGAIGVATNPLVFIQNLNSRFQRQRGTAFGIVFAAVGVVAVLWPFAATALIQRGGWRLVFLGMAIGAALVAPFALGLAGPGSPPIKPEARADRPPPPSVVGQSAYWRLLLVFFLLATGVNGYIFLLAPILKSSQASFAQIALSQSCIGLVGICARFGVGFAMDRVFAPWVGAGVAALVACGLMALAIAPGLSPDYVLPFAAGFGYGIEVDLLGYLSTRYFEPQSAPRAYGFLYPAGIAGTATSPLLLGLLADHTGGYRTGFGCSTVILIVAAALLATAPRFPRPQGDRHPASGSPEVVGTVR